MLLTAAQALGLVDRVGPCLAVERRAAPAGAELAVAGHGERLERGPLRFSPGERRAPSAASRPGRARRVVDVGR